MLDKAKNHGLPAKYLRNVNIRWFQFDLSDMHTMLVSQDEKKLFSVKDGDVFVCEGGEPGRCAVWRGGNNEFVYQKALHRFRTTGAILPELLMYRLRHDAETGALADAFTGTTIKHFTRESVAAFQVPVPPLAEQKRIVAKLDGLLARVYACRERLDRVPAIIKRFRQSVLAAATSGELTREWREERGSTLRDWKRVRVDQLVTVKNGRAFPSADYRNDGVRLLRPGNLHVSGRVVWELNNTKCLPARYAEEFPSYLIRGGELVMNLTAQSLKDEFLGRVCMKTDDTVALLNQRLCAFYPAQTWDARKYLFVYFRSPSFRRYVDTLDSGTLIKHMHSKQVMGHELPLPPADEVAEICRRVEKLFDVADQSEARCAAARRIAERLAPSTLAKAFRGELVPREPKDEPASELLARVRGARGGAGEAARPKRRKSASP